MYTSVRIFRCRLWKLIITPALTVLICKPTIKVNSLMQSMLTYWRLTIYSIEKRILSCAFEYPVFILIVLKEKYEYTHFYVEECILHSYVVVFFHDKIYNSLQHLNNIFPEGSYHILCN